jgi:hypothetical protein
LQQRTINVTKVFPRRAAGVTGNLQALGMAKVQIRLTLPDNGVGGAELELNAPFQSEAAVRLFAALASAGVNPLSDYFVHAGDRLIAHVKLSEHDGSTLSQRRAAEVLRAVEQYLTCQITAGDNGPPKDLPSRPDPSYSPPLAA